MIELFKYYIEAPLHPFALQERYYQFRHRPFGSVSPDQNGNVDYFESGIDFTSLVLMSWPLVIIEALYQLFGFHISEWLVENYFGNDAVTSYFSRVESSLTWQIFFILLRVAAFPIISWFSVKVWAAIISFFHHFLQKDERDIPGIDQVANNTLSSNLFLLIPIFGPFLKWISMIIQVYGGLRYNLRYSKGQSLVVILSPLILLSFAIFFGAFFLTFFMGELFFNFMG